MQGHDSVGKLYVECLHVLRYTVLKASRLTEGASASKSCPRGVSHPAFVPQFFFCLNEWG